MGVRKAVGDEPVNLDSFVQALHAIEKVAVDEMDEFLLEIVAVCTVSPPLQRLDDELDRPQSFV